MDQRAKRNIQPFNGDRYSTWKFRIKSLLAELQVSSVIEEPAPEKPDDAWTRKNLIAKGTIVEYLDDAFLNFAKDTDTAKAVIDNLDKIYERRSLATQLALRKQLLNLKLQPDVNLIQHFRNFDSLTTELISAGAKLEEMDKISHLLLTLPTTYDGVITALETLGEDNLNLAFVKTRLLDQEVKIKNETVTGLKVLHAASDKFSHHIPNLKRKRPVDHASSYVPDYKNKKPNNYHQQFKTNQHPRNKPHHFSRMYCDYCGRRNHFKQNCRYYKKSQENSNSGGTSSQQTQQPRRNIAHAAAPNQNNEDSFAFMFSQCELSKPNHNSNDITFLLDSGATDHIVNNQDFFSAYTQITSPLKINIAKTGAFIHALGRGRIDVTSNLGKQGSLEEVLYSPEVPYNLLSVNRMQKAGMEIIFNNEGVQIYNNKRCCIMSGITCNNLSKITLTINLQKALSLKASRNSNLYNLWHARLGHVNKQKFNNLKNMIDDYSVIDNIIPPTDELCEPCILGKQSRLPFAKSKPERPNNRPLFIVHSDVCGPITPTTVDDKNYFVNFIDDYTHYTVTYLLHSKSEVLKCFQDYIAKSENLFNCKVVNLYCDNGREYLSNEFKDYCVNKGITYHLTVPYTPVQNSKSERMNRTLTEMARTMVTSAKLGKQFWGEAVLTSTYLINRLPTKALIGKTPYEMWHGIKPKISHLRVFGSTAYVHNKTRKTKFDEKSFKTILIGYAPNGYKLFNTENSQFLVARDVLFDESNFGQSRSMCSDDIPTKINKPNNESVELVKPICYDDKIPAKIDKPNKSVESIDNKQSDVYNKSLNDIKGQLQSDVNNKSLNTDPGCLRRSERIRNLPPKNYEIMNDPDSTVLSLCSKQQLPLPVHFNDIFNRPDTKEWLSAIQSEIDSLRRNQTWCLVEKPSDVNIVSCKWVFTIKNNELGEPVRYKARLVARGFSQQYLEDYDETFAPVARITTFRLIMAFANQNDLLVHHMDVKTAFLNGILKENIYMQVPEGISSKSNHVCKLNKTLYGLKQSSRCWYERFDQVIKSMGFESSKVDPCLYILNKNSIDLNVYIVLYVDDVLIVTKCVQTMQQLKKCLMQQFEMTDLLDIKLFLGIRIERTNDKVTLDQSTYLQNVLNKFSMNDCNPSKSPFPNKLNYDALNSDVQYHAPSRQVIGCLMYAMLCTRPDLCAAVSILSRFQSKGNEELWKCLKHLLRYVKGTLNLKLTYHKCDYKQLMTGYADSDWGGDETDRKSTTGYLFQMFDNCTVSWCTRKQNTVAVSSTEAEYMGLFEAVKEAIWIKSLLSSIYIKVNKPILIYEDNNSCISIANNPTNYKKSKHIDIKYHFTREQINNKVIMLEHISTGNQLADMFTKAIPMTKFHDLRVKLNLI